MLNQIIEFLITLSFLLLFAWGTRISSHWGILLCFLSGALVGVFKAYVIDNYKKEMGHE